MTCLRSFVFLAVIGLLGHVSAARADLIQIGAFNQTENVNAYSFDPITGTVSGSATVSFAFNEPTPPILATATLTMTTTQPVVEASDGWLVATYSSIDVKITAQTAIGGKTNLLTMHADNGIFAEQTGGMTLDCSGSGYSPSVLYSSDFFTLKPGTFGTFTIGFITNGGVMKDPTTGFVASDNPPGSALYGMVNSQFSIITVPEPSSLMLVGLGLCSVPVAWRRRRAG